MLILYNDNSIGYIASMQVTNKFNKESYKYTN